MKDAGKALKQLLRHQREKQGEKHFERRKQKITNMKRQKQTLRALCRQVAIKFSWISLESFRKTTTRKGASRRMLILLHSSNLSKHLFTDTFEERNGLAGRRAGRRKYNKDVKKFTM